MRALVTGASGFVGAALCRALIDRGWDVRAFHRASSSLKMLEGLPVEHVIGDLTQPQTLEPAMDGMEVVFHCAAQLGGSDQGRMYTVTVEGTRHVLAAALNAGVRRLVHTSSAAALGLPDHPIDRAPRSGCALMDEKHTWNYRPDFYPYGYAKYLAELEVQKAVVQGLDAVIVNPALVIGAGDVYRSSSSVLVQVAQRKLTAVTRGGINVVHLADVVDGHLAALARGQTGARYLLTGENLSHEEFLHKIAAAASVPPPAIVIPAGVLRGSVGLLKGLAAYNVLPVDIQTLRFAGYCFFYDATRSRRALGLPAPRPADLAIREALDWFRAAGALD